MLSFVLLSSFARAETYLVNPEGTGDFPDLETALEQVVDGDVIELADGTYYNLAGFDFLGKAITVRSQSGIPEQCTIQYSSYGCTESGFTFQSGEGPSSVLEGVQLISDFEFGRCRRKKGSCSGSAGVAVLNGSSPTLINLLFQNNPDGVRTCDSSPRLQDCRFVSNGIGVLTVGKSAPFAIATSTFDQNGKGIVCEGSLGTITGCLLTKNVAYSSYYSVGAGVTLRLGSSVEIDSCLIQGNGLGIAVEESEPTLTNCLITGNGYGAGGVIAYSNSDVRIGRCTIAGNFTEDNDAGGVSAHSSTVLVEKSIVWGNCGYGKTDLYADSDGVITVTCTLTDSLNSGGSGTIEYVGTNVFVDPLFTEPRECWFSPTTDGNYCPTKFSPAWHVPGCGNLGAVVDDCSVAVTPTSWGQIKALYR